MVQDRHSEQPMACTHHIMFRLLHLKPVLRALSLLLAIPLLGLRFGPGHANAQDYRTQFTVAKDGSGDFTSIQAALDASKSFPYVRITIHIKNGVYHEKVLVPAWNTKISLIGESRDSTFITYDDYFKKINRGRNSTFFTATLRVDGNDFRAENLTIENSAGPVGQALALHVEADRCSFVNCRILGNQDTVYLAGEGARDFFKDCHIEGTTDFIFGEATAVFEECTIESKANSYITAASTPAGVPFGFVFMDCTLTAAAGVDEVYLGRPWRDYAKTVYLHCWLGDHIRPQGWGNWGSERAEKETFYAVYQNKGPGASPDARAAWTHQLTAEQAKRYKVTNILNGWEPEI